MSTSNPISYRTDRRILLRIERHPTQSCRPQRYVTFPPKLVTHIGAVSMVPGAGRPSNPAFNVSELLRSRSLRGPSCKCSRCSACATTCSRSPTRADGGRWRLARPEPSAGESQREKPRFVWRGNWTNSTAPPGGADSRLPLQQPRPLGPQ